MRLWHNPRCSKSRHALALLEEAGHAPEIYLYLQDPADRDALSTVLVKLGIPAASLVRTGQSEWAATGLTPDSAEADIVQAMIDHPILIERPILETPDKAVIGRPPDAVINLAGG